MARYEVQYDKEWEGTKEYFVWESGQIARLANSCTKVWVGSDGIPRCAQCSGLLAAMLASCKHAKAVKRFLERVSKGR